MQSPEREACIGWIVAGGQARRLGGTDKCLINFQGQPLLLRARARLQPQTHRCLLNANGDPGRFLAAGWPETDAVVADRQMDRGPLAGIEAGLHWLQTEPEQWLLTVPGDCPFISAQLRAQLADHWTPERPLLLAQAGGRRHPLFGLWHQSLLPAVTSALAGGALKLQKLAEDQDAHWVNFSDPDSFTNINTPEQLQALHQSRINQ